MRRWGLMAGVMVLAGAASIAAWRVAVFTASVATELDRAGALTSIAPRPQSTIVFDRHGKPAFSFFVEQRIVGSARSRLAAHGQAILSVEDRRFFQHFGIDPVRIVGAAWRNLRAGRIVEGGSTITQQLARAAQLSPVRTYERKIREILVAARLEERYSKARDPRGISQHGLLRRGLLRRRSGVARLLRKVGRGPQPRRRGAARRAGAFAVDRRSMRLAVRATRRRNLVLALMRNQGRISPADFQAARGDRVPGRVAQERAAHGCARAGGANGLYFQEEVRRQLFSCSAPTGCCAAAFASTRPTTPRCSSDAEQAIAKRIEQIAGARKGARDLQGSLVAMSPDFRRRLRASSAAGISARAASTARPRRGGRRDPPSSRSSTRRRSSAAFPRARSSSDLDTPIDGSDDWMPNGEHERDEYTVRGALKVSSNRAAAQLLQQVGVTTAIYYAQRLGIASRLPIVPSLALGTGEVTLLELTAAYSAFANRGFRRLAAADAARRGPVGHDRLVRRGAPHSGDQLDHRLSDVQHALGRRHRAAPRPASARRASSCRPAARPAPPTTMPTPGSSAIRRTC